MEYRIESLKLFDPVGIALIKKVCDKTGCKIILSSTWRKHYTCKELSKVLDLPIIDSTPIKLSSTRGEEVNMWLEKNKVEKYAIIDDDGDIFEDQLPFFVQTNSQNGITYADYLQLLKILGENECLKKS
jgi:hypothetical protein